MNTSRTMAPIVPRTEPPLSADVPRHWLADHMVATHIANGVNLLFPVGERAFVRSVNHFLPTLHDPELRARVKGFFGQEGRHAHAHDGFNDVLRAQGYRIDDFLERYQRVVGLIEARLSPTLRLAMTAAAEHFTAIMARDALSNAAPLAFAHPDMRALLGWHAAEEIEHKAVAFDVLTEVDPSYLVRVTGLALASVTLAGYWAWATTHLLRQEGLGWPEALRRLRALRAAAPPGAAPREPIVRRVFLRGIRAYLRRDFHPDDVDDYHLARDHFAAAAAAA